MDLPLNKNNGSKFWQNFILKRMPWSCGASVRIKEHLLSTFSKKCWSLQSTIFKCQNNLFHLFNIYSYLLVRNIGAYSLWYSNTKIACSIIPLLCYRQIKNFKTITGCETGIVIQITLCLFVPSQHVFLGWQK